MPKRMFKQAVACFAENIDTLLEMKQLHQALQFAYDAAGWCITHGLHGRAEMFLEDAKIIEGRMN